MTTCFTDLLATSSSTSGPRRPKKSPPDLSDLAGTEETISTRQVQLSRPFGWLLALVAAAVMAMNAD
jgi:hypothetical protein